MYNVNKEKIHPVGEVDSTAQGWLDKNKDSLKYAGDKAKKSIHAGLEDAHSFMKDADEGTSFGKVQDAAVKWRLASDANDKRLAHTARNEMIGHLSSENKETYLKNAQPLRAYIDAKDEYDYRQRAYTTTENVDKTPREAVRQTQRMLNEAGYTDKFGEPLKEDGILAGKTQYALDKLKENAEKEERADENISQRFGNRVNLPVRTGERPGTREMYQNRPIIESNKPSITYTNESGLTKWRELPDIVQRLPKETHLFRNRKISTKMYNAMDKISQRWYYAETDKARDEISDLASIIRDNNYDVNDCSNEANEQLYYNGNVIKSFRFVGTAPPSNFKKLFYTLACYTATGIGWYSLVKTGGKWDYKVRIEENEWIPKNKVFWYYDQIISVADFGNLNYGYTGTILGLTPETLYKGGGKVNPNQTQYEIDNYYGDTEVDHYWIKKGIELANEQGYTGKLELDVDKIFEMKGSLGI